MKKILLILVLIFVAGLLTAWLRYGGGEEYPNLTTSPMLSETLLEEVLSYREPIGNVAVSSDGRVFFTVHPESRPRGNRLLEYVNGASVPFPDSATQQDLFDTVLGMAIDRSDILWTIDHGNHGLRTPRLLAFDLTTGDVVHDHRIDESVAPAGSYLQDLQVTADGKALVIADASIWRQSPALIVYDIETATARRVLENHASVQAEKYLITANQRSMSFLGGVVTLRGGVDGIALTDDWLYFGALNGSGLYRVALNDLLNTALPDSQLAASVERVAAKPLSNGFSADLDGRIYLTDIEHNAIAVADASGEVVTMLRSKDIRWPDALSFGPEGWLYVSDSALDEVVFQSRDHIKSAGPYRVFRFQPGAQGTPGH